MTLPVSELRPRAAPRLPEEPGGGNGGPPPSSHPESTCLPEPLPAVRTPGLPQGPSARRRGDGFSLIELLNVILILGVVTAIAIPMVQGAVQRAREAAVIAYMKGWPSAVTLFELNAGRYPATFDELIQSRNLSDTTIGTYSFLLTQKFAGGPVPLSPFKVVAQVSPWWTALTELTDLRFVGTAWANHQAASAQGNNSGQGCDPGNPNPGLACSGGGQGSGGTTGSATSGTVIGWEGWANPLNSQGRYFYIDEYGSVHYAYGRPANGGDPQL